MPASSESLEPYLVQLRSLPIVKSAKILSLDPSPQVDAHLRLRTAAGPHDLWVEEKTSHLGRGVVEQIRLHMKKHAGPWILFAPYVGAPLGEALEHAGINFIDRQGNCSIRLGPTLMARVQGRRAAPSPARSKSLRAPGYQVLFALLARPDLVSAPVREIAEEAGVSRQPVVDLLARLVEERVLLRRGRKHAWVEDRRAPLIDRFVEGYAAAVRPKLLAGRFRVPPQSDGPRGLEAFVSAALVRKGDEAPVRFGGTTGAHRLDPHYRGPLTTIHFPYSDAARQRLKASPAKDGELVWLEPLSPLGDRGRTPDTVHPLLIYAELAVDPDPRAAEEAERIRDLLEVGDE